jgi:hypothetical protein
MAAGQKPTPADDLARWSIDGNEITAMAGTLRFSANYDTRSAA